jgi:hypothetical protein
LCELLIHNQCHFNLHIPNNVNCNPDDDNPNVIHGCHPNFHFDVPDYVYVHFSDHDYHSIVAGDHALHSDSEHNDHDYFADYNYFCYGDFGSDCDNQCSGHLYFDFHGYVPLYYLDFYSDNYDKCPDYFNDYEYTYVSRPSDLNCHILLN